MGVELINKLKAEGWKQQFSASGGKLKEAIDNYAWLGFEVKTVPIKELGCDDCTVCFDDENDDSMMIFTRKVKTGQDNELFSDDD
ncbi:MAG: hypothetical protein V3W18_10025 [candidate division Zixibacteria bacterium]